MKLKLLIMASLFFPQKNSGGPPVSLKNLIDAIGPHYEIYVISKNHEINEKEPLPDIREGWNNFSFGKACYLDYGRHTIRNVLRLMKSVRPDIIYQNSFFSHDDMFPILLYKRLIDKNVKVIVAPRGEFQQNALKKGGLKKKAYIALMRILGASAQLKWQVAAAVEAENISVLLGVEKKEIAVIPNLSSVVGKEQLKAARKEKDELKLAYIARIHPHKNLDFALRSLRNVSGDIRFFIYGSIEDPEYWEACIKEIARLPSNVRCSYEGYLENREVGKALGFCHVLYLPSSSEAYGQSIVEAMMTKTPVLISDQTPWTGINQAHAGFALPIGDSEAFTAVLQNLTDMDGEKYLALSENAYRYIQGELDFDQTVEQYMRLFQKDPGQPQRTMPKEEFTRKYKKERL